MFVNDQTLANVDSYGTYMQVIVKLSLHSWVQRCTYDVEFCSLISRLCKIELSMEDGLQDLMLH